MSVAITRGGRPLLERAWGVANVGTGQLAEPTTIYDIGSVAKQFTAALVLKLVDRGKLSLTDSIGRHLTGLRPEWNAILIEQLLGPLQLVRHPIAMARFGLTGLRSASHLARGRFERREGVINLFAGDEKLAPNAWGALAAWAWSGCAWRSC